MMDTLSSHGVNSINREMAQQVTVRTAAVFLTIMDCRECSTGKMSQDADTHVSLQAAVEHADFLLEDAGIDGCKYQYEFQNILALDGKGQFIAQWDLNEARWVLDSARRARPGKPVSIKADLFHPSAVEYEGE